MSQSPLVDRLSFKGGTALKQCYFGNYRFSEDLDFTLLQLGSIEEILAEFEEAYQYARAQSGIVLDLSRKAREEHANSHTFFMSYGGPLPSTNRPKEIKVDITISEKLINPVAERCVLKAYDEYGDIPDGAFIPTYSLEEIAMEKVVALMDRAFNASGKPSCSACQKRDVL